MIWSLIQFEIVEEGTLSLCHGWDVYFTPAKQQDGEVDLLSMLASFLSSDRRVRQH